MKEKRKKNNYKIRERCGGDQEGQHCAANRAGEVTEEADCCRPADSSAALLLTSLKPGRQRNTQADA